MLWTVCWTLLARPFPKSTFMPWKRFLLRCFGASVASTANVYATARVFMPWNLVMKDYACLASGVDCYNAATVVVGINATVSQRAFLCTASHDICSPRNEQVERPITIGDGGMGGGRGVHRAWGDCRPGGRGGRKGSDCEGR